MSNETPKDDNLKKQLAPNPMREVASALKSFNENWLMHLEIVEYQSKMIKARYDAAIAQGFTEAQALQICTQPWN